MKKYLILILALTLYACSRPTSESASGLLSPRAFADKLHTDGEAILLDVRTSAELQTGYIQGAKHLDFNSPVFKNSLDSLDHSKAYMVYCASGKRSGKAMEMMKEIGFEKVNAMEGGLRAWNAAGLPIYQP